MKDTLRACFPAFLSGAALVLCFPTFDLGFLAWVALVPFLLSLSGKPSGKAFKSGMALGLPYFFGTQYWVYHSMHHYGGMPLVASFSAVLLLALYEGLFIGLFAVLFARHLRSTSLPAMFLAPVFWTVLEFLRGYALTGFPWSSLGYSQYKYLSVIQFADITGISGVSFLIVAVNGAIADLFIAKWRRARMPLFHLAPTAMGFAAVPIALAAVLVYGHLRLGEPPAGMPLKVSVIQGSIEQDVKWDPAYRKHVMDTYKRLTVQERAKEAPSLIVWPETALPFYYGYDGALTADFVNFQKALGTHLLTGAITVKAPEKLANSALLFGPDGELAHAYDKIHLVPFGEYVPLRRLLFFVDRLAVGIGDYVHGDSTERFVTPQGEFGTLICYEIIFPGLVRKFYRDGGDFIVTITNDAWFGTTAGPYQHWSMAVLRAVENRKPVIRAANSGISGFIDSKGRVLAKTGLFERRALTETITTDQTRTFYSKYGDLFAYFCIAATVVLLFL